MPLYFTDSHRRWPPSKPVQYILAALALLLALAILIGWLCSRFIFITPADDQEDDSSDLASAEELPNTAYCLFIIEDAGCEQFALIRFAPKKGDVTVQPISPTMEVNDNDTMARLYQRAKAADLTKAVAAHYRLPVNHYISVSISELESLINAWCGSLRIPLPEDVSYRDENGTKVHLTTDHGTLSAKQIASVLRYTQWKDAKSGTNVAADITTAWMNHVLQPNRNLTRYYSQLADVGTTSLLIHHFNAYHNGLIHLASLNDGHLVHRENVS